MGELRQDLLDSGLELRETHISWVFLSEDRVWKIKRPVALGFLDFSTLDRRRAACEAEIELNRRLAPDVYLGLSPIRRSDDGRHRIDGDRGEIVDWAVSMRRLPDRSRADQLLEAGNLDEDRIDQLAQRLADFHSRSPTSEAITAYGAPDAIAGNVEENFEQTRESIQHYLEKDEVAELVEDQRSFLSDHREAFEDRMRAGRIRDGHGDLRLEHCYFLDDGLAIIDCIEFNDRFRYGDVAIDLAFLAMDLDWHGRVDLGERLLARYALLSNDYDFYPLIDFYAGYRAYVRAKIASLCAIDQDLDWSERQSADHAARPYYLLALACDRQPLLEPRVVAVGGWIGAGKTTVANWLCSELSAPRVSSDRTRKFILGESPSTKNLDDPFSGAYTAEISERVYEEVLRRADAVLRSGRSVVLDASFRTIDDRRRARDLAAEHGVPFHLVECRLDREELRARLKQRDLANEVSDGRAEILDSFIEGWETIDELATGEHLVLDTSMPKDAVLERLRRAIPTWPRGLTA